MAKKKEKVPEGSKRCTKCKHIKRLEAFSPARRNRDGLASWCKACTRVYSSKYRQTEGYRKARAKRRSNPKVQQRAREARKRYYQRDPKRYQEQRQKYLQSARGSIVRCRISARKRLRTVKSEEKKKELEKLIEQYNAELARMDREKAARKKA